MPTEWPRAGWKTVENFPMRTSVIPTDGVIELAFGNAGSPAEIILMLTRRQAMHLSERLRVLASALPDDSQPTADPLPHVSGEVIAEIELDITDIGQGTRLYGYSDPQPTANPTATDGAGR